MTKRQFIESYILELQNCLKKFREGDMPEDFLFEKIYEVESVFVREAPEIADAIWLRQGTAERDANAVIGILRLHMIDVSEEANTSEDEMTKTFQELKVEYEGIKNTIDDYTRNANITNYLAHLGEGIALGDIPKIKYCLEAILNWYQKNISKIHSNQYVFNADSHDENFEKIKRFQKVFENATDDCLVKANNKEAPKSEPIIFLSHKSDDKKYADALEKFITGLGVKNKQLIYTSHPLHKIPLGANIYDYLRSRINSNTFMIILWSDKYLESPACMNELGAAWVIQSDYTNIYVPSFSFGNPKYRECAVDTSKMGAVLNGDDHCKASMIELKNKIQSLFNLENDEQTSQHLLDNFIKEIQEEV